MAKTCQYEGCNNPVFSKGYCIYHQRKTGFPLNRKPFSTRKSIRKVSKNQWTKLTDRSQLSAKDRLLWAEIWEEREHIDFETGEPIYGEPLTLYFHHILPKRKNGGYPQFRYEKWNIVIVSWDTHTNCENHNWKKVPRITAYRDELIKKYT
jgi:hypothetical protein